MKTEIIGVRYEGGVFKPLHPVATAKKFEEGEIYFFRPEKTRYLPRHRAFMALIREAWESLPDHVQETEFPTPDILRMRLLIATRDKRLCKITSIVCYNEDDASRRVAEMAGYLNDHTFISVKDDIIVIAMAESQAMDEMDADTFKESCYAVNVELAKLLKCDVNDIKAHAASLRAAKDQRVSP